MANQNPIPTSTNYSQTTTPQTPVFAHSTQTSPQQVLNRTKEQQQKTFLRLITHITELAEKMIGQKGIITEQVCQRINRLDLINHLMMFGGSELISKKLGIPLIVRFVCGMRGQRLNYIRRMGESTLEHLDGHKASTSTQSRTPLPTNSGVSTPLSQHEKNNQSQIMPAPKSSDQSSKPLLSPQAIQDLLDKNAVMITQIMQLSSNPSKESNTAKLNQLKQELSRSLNYLAQLSDFYAAAKIAPPPSIKVLSKFAFQKPHQYQTKEQSEEQNSKENVTDDTSKGPTGEAENKTDEHIENMNQLNANSTTIKREYEMIENDSLVETPPKMIKIENGCGDQNVKTEDVIREDEQESQGIKIEEPVVEN